MNQTSPSRYYGSRNNGITNTKPLDYRSNNTMDYNRVPSTRQVVTITNNDGSKSTTTGSVVYTRPSGNSSLGNKLGTQSTNNRYTETGASVVRRRGNSGENVLFL